MEIHGLPVKSLTTDSPLQKPSSMTYSTAKVITMRRISMNNIFFRFLIMFDSSKIMPFISRRFEQC